MVHERFDLERWIAEFPLARLRQEARDIVSQRRKEMPREYRDEAAFERHVRLMMPCGEIVTSPIHVVVNEQLRREACGGTRATDAVTTDIFVMAEGEPPRPRCHQSRRAAVLADRPCVAARARWGAGGLPGTDQFPRLT